MFLIDVSTKNEFQFFEVQKRDLGGGVQTTPITIITTTTTPVLVAEALGKTNFPTIEVSDR